MLKKLLIATAMVVGLATVPAIAATPTAHHHHHHHVVKHHHHHHHHHHHVVEAPGPPPPSSREAPREAEGLSFVSAETAALTATSFRAGDRPPGSFCFWGWRRAAALKRQALRPARGS